MLKLALHDSHTISGDTGRPLALPKLEFLWAVVYTCVVWMSSRTRLAPCPIQKGEDTCINNQLIITGVSTVETEYSNRI